MHFRLALTPVTGNEPGLRIRIRASETAAPLPRRTAGGTLGRTMERKEMRAAATGSELEEGSRERRSREEEAAPK